MSELSIGSSPVAAPHAGADLQSAVDLIATRFDLLRDDLRALRYAAIDGGGTAPCTPQAALARFVEGCPQADDDSLLGVPVEGARIVVVPGLAPPARRDLRIELATERDAVMTEHPTAGVVTLVRGQPHGAGDDRALRRAVRFAHQARRADRAARCGISSPVRRGAQLPQALADALDALSAGEDVGTPWVVAEDVWARIAIERVRRTLAACLPLAHPLQRLADYERTHRSDLAGTVGVWLELHGDTTRAADALSVHPNTLRYRLRRAEDVSGLDLSSSEDRLIALLARLA